MAGKEIRAGKAFVEILLRNNLQAGLKRAAKQLRAFATLTSTIGVGLTGASAAILGPIGVAVQQFSDVGESVKKMALRTGMSTEAISELSHAASVSGTDLQAMEAGMRKMHDAVLDAARGGQQARDALSRLGLSAQALVAMSPDERLSAIADRLMAVRSPALRTAMAMDVFGKAGVQILPMLSGGAAGLAAMRQQARALGLSMSADTVKAASQLNDALGLVWQSVKGLTLNIGAALVPTVSDLAERITSVISFATQFVQKNRQLVVSVATAAVAMGLAGMAFFSLSGMSAAAAVAASGLASAVGAVASVVGTISTTLAAALSPIGLVVTALGAGAAAWLYFSGTAGMAIDWIRSRFAQLVAFVGTVAGGIGDALLAGDLQLATRILWSGIKVAFYRGAAELVSVWASIQSAAADAWNGIRGVVGQVVAWLGGQWEAIQRIAAGTWQSIAGAAASAFAQVHNAVAAGMSTAVAVATRTWGSFLVVIRSTPARVQAALSTVATAVTQAFAAIPSVVRTVAGAAYGFLTAAFHKLPSAVQNIAGAVGQVFAEAVALVSSVLRGIAGLVYTYLQPFIAVGRVAFGALASAARLAFSTIAAVVTTVAPIVFSVWKRLFNLVLSARAIVLSVRSAIMSAWSGIVATIGRAASAAIQTASAILGGLIRIVSRVASMTLGPFQGLVAAIGNLLATIVEEGGKVFGGLLGKVYGFVSSVIAILARPMEVVRSIWNQITATVASVARGIASAFHTAVASVQAAFSGLWQWISTMASQAVSLVSQAFTALTQGIMNAFSAVTGFLGNAFRAYVQSGAAVASGLSSAFSSFKSSATESLSAIAKAMMHGEFALAGEVAWTSIKLAFVQGIAWVTDAWTEFATGLATIFDGVIVAIRTAWNNLTVFIGQLLMYQVARFQMLLDQLAQFDPTGLAAKLRSALDVNVGGTITAMEEDRERFNRGLADAREKRDAERAAHMQARLADTEARLAELRRQREDALARARSAVETSEKEGGGSPLAGAMDELRKALAEAAAAPKLFDAGAASDKLEPAGAGLDDMMLNSGGKGLSSQGTFSAAAVWGLAAGGVNERAAKAAEATAQNTRQLVDHARRGRLVFG